MTLVLASASRTRQALLANAGIEFRILAAELDERAAEQPLLEAEAAPEDVAVALSAAKALSVSELRPDALVIGADQVLDLQGARLHKPADMEVARRQLLALQGRTHQLHSAVACARGGSVLWHAVDTAHLTMRPLEPPEVGRYLARTGPAALSSVGAYQLEGLGIHLFERVEGDYFTVLGLPLLPLLGFLRTRPGLVPL